MPQGHVFLLVRAVDRAGWAATLTRNITIDTVPPNCTARIAGEQYRTVQGASAVAAQWNCTDRGSGVVSVAWAIGTSPGGDDIASGVGLASAGEGAPIAVQLVHGQKLFVTVTATDGGGLTSTHVSAPMVVDDRAPLALGAPRLGTDPLASLYRNRYATNATHLALAWRFVDPISGVASVRLSLVANATSDVVLQAAAAVPAAADHYTWALPIPLSDGAASVSYTHLTLPTILLV